MDAGLQSRLQGFWPTDSALRRLLRGTPAWRVIKGQLSPNFNLREFACKDGTPYVDGLVREQGLSKEQAKRRARELAERLERVRKAGGGGRLDLNSVFRTRAHNAKQPGSATNSPHLRGFAADMARPAGVTLTQHRANVRAAFECGVGYYPNGNFIHGDFDHGLGRRKWNGP
jgi:zinc D-Ala-D-Ala carboxypeptidase